MERFAEPVERELPNRSALKGWGNFHRPFRARRYLLFSTGSAKRSTRGYTPLPFQGKNS